MLRVTSTDQGSRYDVRLSGTLANLLVIGAVSYLKNRKALRLVVAAAGLIGVVVGGWLFLFRDFIFEGRILGPLATPVVITGFGMVMCAILAGPQFNLSVGDPPEVEERREAEENIKDSRDPYASLDLDLKRLSEYYAINQSQARGSFRWAVFAMFCGLGTIMTGIWIFYFRQGTPDTFLASLSTAAGLVTNVVSGLYLYLHNKTQRRSLFYYGQLTRIQHLGLAIRLAESHATAEDRASAKNKVIDQILAIVSVSAERDNEEVKREVA